MAYCVFENEHLTTGRITFGHTGITTSGTIYWGGIQPPCSKEQERMTDKALYQVYIVNLVDDSVQSVLVVATASEKAQMKAFAKLGLSADEIDSYHFICDEVGDVPTLDED